ncbi:MAG TPA: hypothetical protein VFP90_15085 [Gemmatimonadaceae bacterium]|nr:hypothetical protein [Gemmatimonadaceae bacterium]
MASRRPETMVKRAREQALRERRERKQQKKEARAAEKLAPQDETLEPAEGDEIVDEVTDLE